MYFDCKTCLHVVCTYLLPLKYFGLHISNSIILLQTTVYSQNFEDFLQSEGIDNKVEPSFKKVSKGKKVTFNEDVKQHIFYGDWKPKRRHAKKPKLEDLDSDTSLCQNEVKGKLDEVFQKLSN